MSQSNSLVRNVEGHTPPTTTDTLQQLVELLKAKTTPEASTATPATINQDVTHATFKAFTSMKPPEFKGSTGINRPN